MSEVTSRDVLHEAEAANGALYLPVGALWLQVGAQVAWDNIPNLGSVDIKALAKKWLEMMVQNAPWIGAGPFRGQNKPHVTSELQRAAIPQLAVAGTRFVVSLHRQCQYIASLLSSSDASGRSIPLVMLPVHPPTSYENGMEALKTAAAKFDTKLALPRNKVLLGWRLQDQVGCMAQTDQIGSYEYVSLALF